MSTRGTEWSGPGAGPPGGLIPADRGTVGSGSRIHCRLRIPEQPLPRAPNASPVRRSSRTDVGNGRVMVRTRRPAASRLLRASAGAHGPFVPFPTAPGSVPGAPLSSEDGTRTGRLGAVLCPAVLGCSA